MNILISWKNVWRNKLRSLVIISAIAIGLYGGIFSNAFFVGMAQQRVKSAIKYETSNIQIHNPEFILDESITNGIENTSIIVNKLQNIPNIHGISTRISEAGMVSTADANAGVIVNGIVADEEQKVTAIFEKITQGTYLNASDLIPIIVGQKLAKKLNAELGNKIILSMASYDGEVTYGAFKIRGIYNTNNDMFDGMQVYVNKEDLHKLLKTPDDYATEIVISLLDDTQSPQTLLEISNVLEEKIQAGHLIVQDWKEIEPALNMMIQTMDYFAWFFIIIILIALAFGIVNTMMMVVMERTREIGMLMSIGMNKYRIFTMILWETLFLSLVGAFFGIFLSVITIAYFGKYGIDLSIVSSGLNALGMDTISYPTVSIDFYIMVGFLVVITAVVASIFPSLKALKLRPAEAVRE